MVLTAPLDAEEQSPKRLPRVGVLAPLAPPPAPNPDIDGFRQGLKDLGYVEGVNIALEYRWESGQRDRTAVLA